MSDVEAAFDVVAVNIKTNAHRFLAEGKTLCDAHAVMDIAIMRHGVDVEFYKVVAAGTYSDE